MNKVIVKRILFLALIALCATPFVSSPFALLGGFLFSTFLGHPFPKLGSKATSLLLKVSVVGLGFGMNVHSAMTVGKEGFWLTVSSITLVLVLGYLIGKLLKLPTKSSHLVASGTAICGGSAIAAVAPTLEASEKETSVALGVIFLLNSLALFIFPVLGHMIGLSEHQFGMWCAIAIHDTSSVVGAASAYGEEALQIATTVKLARALWIIPVALLTMFLFRGSNRKISIPWFIGLFVIAMVVNSYLPVIHVVTGVMFDISKSLLVVTLFLIGASLSVDKIRSAGIKNLVLGVVLWVIISVLSLLAILHL